MRTTWAVLGAADAAVTALQTAVTTAAAKADAAMTKANSAATTASSASTTAGTAVATLDQLTTAQTRADLVHQGFADGIAALQSRVQRISFGYSVLPAALLVNGTVDIPVTLSRDMARTDYNVEVRGPGGLTVTDVKSKTSTGLTVTVKATAALAVGTPLFVIAWI